MAGNIQLVMPKPNPKQHMAFLEEHRYVGYGGARGGGKSWFVRWKATLLCLTYPGIKILITRKTYRELLNNHIVPLLSMLHGIAVYNRSDKRFNFPNGSTIWFGYCASDSDLGQYQGAEYDIWFADEAGQFPEEWLTTIDACVRGANEFPKRTYYTLNPGGPSHGYFRRLFVDRRYEDKEHPEDYAFIQALCTDNEALMRLQPEYLRSLEKLPPKIRKAWLEGSWDVYQGQFFEDFINSEEHYLDRQWTHVIEPFEIPDSWQIYRSFDWGYNKPFSCGWWAVNHDGVVYRILELYGCNGTPNEGVKWTPPQVFSEIHRIETEHRWLVGKKIIGIADPAIWDAETGESIADVAAKHQVFFGKGDHKRIPGWMQVHYRFQFDENGFPMMYVFRYCQAFIRTMPILQYDDHKPEDLDTDGEDHVADEVRYFLMSRPIKPRHEAPPDTYKQSPLHLFLDISKEDIKAASKRPRLEIIDD
jgi:hypothetical protein